MSLTNTKASNASPRFSPTLGGSYLYLSQWNLISTATWNNHAIDKQRLRHGRIFSSDDRAGAVAVRRDIDTALGITRNKR